MNHADRSVPLQLAHALGSPIAPLIALARRIGAARSNAVFWGENGTGKEAFARLIHASGEEEEPFVVVQCAKRLEPDVERELLSGPEAVLAPGRRGTVFLEDVADLPAAIQGRLVRALDGGTGAGPRVIGASARDLGVEVAGGRFRRDLYDVLAYPAYVPPLRERRDDVLAIFDRCCADLGCQLLLTDAARALLPFYGWPGNVREVEALVRRLVTSSGTLRVTPRDVEREVLAGSLPAAWLLAREGHECETAGPRTSTAAGLAALGFELPPGGGAIDLAAILGRLEMELIEWALERSGGNKTAAAELLGLRRTTLADRLRRAGPSGATTGARSPMGERRTSTERAT